MESINRGGNPQHAGIAGPGGVFLDQCILLEPLNGSRTGLSYKAWHHVIGRIVAVKFRAAEAAASAMLTARFQREIQFLARLEHRNLAKVFGAGEQGSAQFLVMEFVDGKDLRSVLTEKGPLSVEYAVHYITQAAAGLAAIHQQGICHRNIEPGNLLVDREGVIKIVGFLPAHAEAGGAIGEAGLADQLTRQGQMIGTCDYMSPEQVADSSRVDRRADIYSLGCTLHALLTGRPPYEGKTTVQQILAHRTGPIPSLRQVRPDVPETLDRLFRKMVAKAPADRPASMEDVTAELGACLMATPPVARSMPGNPPAIIGLATAAAPAKLEASPSPPLFEFPSEDLQATNGLPSAAPSPKLAAVAAPPSVAESSPDDLRAIIGLTSPAPPRVATAAAARPAPRKRRRKSRIAPVVVGGALAVVALAFAFRYYNDNEPAEVADSAKAGNGAKPSGARPTESPATVPSPSKDTSQRTTTPQPPPVDKTAAETPNAATNPPNKEEPEVKPGPDGKTPAPAGSENAGHKSGDSRAAVPDAAARKRALKLVQDAFQEELGKARTGKQKALLAKEMLRKSETMGDNPAERFVMLETSYNLAKEANDPATALEAIDLTASGYAVDAWPKKSRLMADLAKGAKLPEHHRALADQALLAAQKATDERRLDIAASLSKLALAEASKALSPELLVRARAVAKESDKALTRFREYETATATLRAEPGNANANLTAGRYECLVSGDWDTGLPKLAAGSDDLLRGLAAKDLAAPKDSDDQVALGDQWYEFAKDKAGLDQANLYRRAAWWYEKALSQATGLLKTKLEKRLEMIRATATRATGP